jgi:hypothetical protein
MAGGPKEPFYFDRKKLLDDFSKIFFRNQKPLHG